jgi:hypothetical protein
MSIKYKYGAKTLEEEKVKREQAKLTYQANIEKTKQYYQDNKEQFWKRDRESLSKYNSDYYLKHKESIDEKSKERARLNKEKNSIKITCVCGNTFKKSRFVSHLKTDKHKRLMKKKDELLSNQLQGRQTDMVINATALNNDDKDDDNDDIKEEFNYNWRPSHYNTELL